MPGGIHPPLEVIISWPLTNTVNPEQRPKIMPILAVVLGLITFVVFMARLWVRIFNQRNPGWDDWLMLAAMIPTIVLTVLYPLATEHGFNLHVWDAIADTEKLVTSRKHILIIECLFCVASGMIKISILLFYRRLSNRVVSRFFWWATWVTIGFIIAYSIALTLAPILGCQPVSAFWDQVNTLKVLSGYKYHCFDEGADIFAASVVSVFQDFITALLPTFLYWNLHIPIRQKVALFGIFAIGYGVVAIGCARAYYSWRTFYATYDVTWSTWDLMLTSLLELHLGCFCANAPALKVIFKQFFRDRHIPSPRLRSRRMARLHPSDGNSTGSKWSTISTNFFGKFGSIISNSSHSKSRDGYISESQANVSVDAQGCVCVQREIHVTHSPCTSCILPPTEAHTSLATVDLLYDQYYEDIDLGQYNTGQNSRSLSVASTGAFESMDLTALPPLPVSPAPTQASSMYSHIQSPIEKEPPRKEGRDMKKKVRERSPTPVPMQSMERKEREWRS